MSRSVFARERISVPAQRWTRRQLALLKARARLLGHRSVDFDVVRTGPPHSWDSVEGYLTWWFTAEPPRRVLSGFWAVSKTSDIPF